jgi:integrase
MQNGSITRSTRSHGPDVWEFRWREAGADGKRKHRRMVIGSIAQFSDKSSVLLEVAALRRQINLNDPRLSLQPVTVSDLVNHYRQRELATDHTWKTHSTKITYQGYLNKWILPRWRNYTLSAINAGEVELWLRSLPLARATCAKIRNLMSVLFNHGIRYQVCSSNPIRLVRQSAKRPECQRGATVVRRAGPQRTDPRTVGCGHGIENERTVWAEMEGRRLRCQ